MNASTVSSILHAAVIAVGIAGYVVLTATGHDGNAVLTAALAWGGAAATDRAIAASSSTPPSPTPPPAP